MASGGFPCQPVSVAGRREGMADERWLWPAFREVVRIIRPGWVLVENVPGLLSIDAGRLFGGILRDLAQLGYDASWQVLPAAAFGAPHLRKRVFIVAYAESEPLRSAPASDIESTAHTNKKRSQKKWTNHNSQRREGQNKRPFGLCSGTIGTDWRSIKPTIRRGDDGTAYRVDRLKCLGNAVVPQAAEWIGRTIQNM